jgi:uncharacterized membrane protein YjfL (UPF0719 family)
MSFSSLLNAIGFASAGILVFALALAIVARALPGNLWQQAMVEKNTQAAIVLAGVALALGWIVAAAVH